MIQTLSDALAERGYDTLTPVQEAVTDPELEGADLLVSAQTGSGKTVGFGLAIGPTLLDEAGRLGPAATPLALVIAPTRELAFQVKRELDWLYAKAGARVTSCVGGMDMRDERRALERGAHIVVGTPGRLVDHIKRGSLDMASLRAVVLDEADEMLDLGFREDLEFMLGEAPEDRRTLMFSATVPPMIATLAQKYQRDAVRVTTVSEKSQHSDITYQALTVAQHDAENAIINVLRFHEAQNAIVFANTRATVNRLTARFANRGFQVVCLSGELSQTERSHALQAMRDGRARVCVATDVAARGIDLPNLELVIHAELPKNTEGLLHRSGRTGRAGRKGISALVVPPKLAKRAERLLKSSRVTAEWITAPSAEDIRRKDEERLLADPAWTEEVTPEEAEFAERLLGLQSPEAIAAACLRLYRANNSAPEELSAPDARPERKERAPFGPSRWFALSVGRDDRAEPRWILPMLCRAGNLTKESIGAIRVQPKETFVELAEPAVDNFLASLGDGKTLEDGVTVRPADGPPDHSRGPRPERDDRRPAGGKPGGKPYKDNKPYKVNSYKDKPRHEAPVSATPVAEAAPAEPAQSEAPAQQRERPAPARKPSAKKVWDEGKVRAPRPPRDEDDEPRRYEGKPKPETARGGEAAPKWKRDKADRGDDGAHGKAKPRGQDRGDARGGSKGAPGKGGGKPWSGKPGGKPSGGKPGGKPTGGKPGGGKPGAPKGAPKRSAASDTSKRFTPPKGGKPGGSQPPKRKR